MNVKGLILVIAILLLYVGAVSAACCLHEYDPLIGDPYMDNCVQAATCPGGWEANDGYCSYELVPGLIWPDTTAHWNCDGDQTEAYENTFDRGWNAVKPECQFGDAMCRGWPAPRTVGFEECSYDSIGGHDGEEIDPGFHCNPDGTVSRYTGEVCWNNFDDNDNGNTDCADALCGEGNSCGTGCACGDDGLEHEIGCSDGEDNDGDGQIDYNDVDCRNQCEEITSFGANFALIALTNPSAVNAGDGCCGDDTEEEELEEGILGQLNDFGFIPSSGNFLCLRDAVDSNGDVDGGYAVIGKEGDTDYGYWNYWRASGLNNAFKIHTLSS